ncbi:DNA polymerase I [Candidatus Uhrbacteria bacterium]|nr:DNA polymerase I [Candidatus Uhrbacteria bacterium]
MKRRTLYILDGNSLLHRAWHALPPLTTRDGRVVHAAYGFTMVVDKILRDYKPDYFAVAWDLPGKTFRHEAVATYKATRVKQPQELYDQIPLCKEILTAYGIPSIEAPGYEADDVIGTVSRRDERENFDTRIVTGDLDTLQLVDHNTHVLFFVKGLSETKTYDAKAVRERYTLDPDQLIDYKAMRGDVSDNVKGIPGVGEKTATEILKKFHSLDKLYTALRTGKTKDLSASLVEKLRKHESDAKESKMLVTIIRDVPMTFDIAEAKISAPDTETLRRLFEGLEFRTLLRRLESPASPRLQETAPHKKSVSLPKGAVGILVTRQSPDLFGSTLGAVAIAEEDHVEIFETPDKKTCEKILARLQKAYRIVTHDYKALLHALDVSPEEVPKAPVFDTMLASYLLHSGTRAHDFPLVVSDALRQSIPELSPKSVKTGASLLGALASVLTERLKKDRLLSLFEQIEVPTAAILYRMECAGILVDKDFLQELGRTFAKEIARLTARIYKEAGEEFNINSPSQLAQVLFERLHIATKGIKKTKTTLSTAADQLEKIEDAHPIVPLIGEYRELAKLKSTYVDALPELVGKDGRIHTTFNQAVAATGRLSSSEPNLQNIPIRTEIGRQIRRAFVAPRGRVFVSADYSQIELRIAAIMAKDKPFLEAFKSGADVHTHTAAQMFGIPDGEVTKDQRRAAKAINFGILYGMGPRALSRNAGVSFEEARNYIARYFEIHHAIADYIAETKIKVRTDGYVETLSGRRRYIPEISSGVPQLVAAAERMAVNMPIQGTEADILKEAMITAEAYIQEHMKEKARMLLQVHDELLFEVIDGATEEFSKKIKKIMEGVVSYEIPMVVEVHTGKNWGEIK